VPLSGLAESVTVLLRPAIEREMGGDDLAKVLAALREQPVGVARDLRRSMEAVWPILRRFQ
jgi:hypothetical protein